LKIVFQRFNKCLDEYFSDFLITLSALEAGGLKIYDLFTAIHEGEISMAKCYVHVANWYVVLEKSLGDPHVALQELSRDLRVSKLASFLRGYSDILVTSGDTKTYVNSSLRAELSNIKARIEESLRILETLYESTIALVLTLSLLVVLPIWSLPAWISVSIIQCIGLISYLLALRVIKRLYYPTHTLLLLCDLLYLLLLPILYSLPGMGLTTLVVLTILHISTKRFLGNLLNVDVEVVKIFREVYSSVLLGRSLDLALVESLSKSQLDALRAVNIGLSRGLEGYEILSRVKVPTLSSKILTLILNPLKYSYTSTAHVTAVNTFIEELMSTRVFVKERSRLYILYILILALLISVSYKMLSQFPLLAQGNTELISFYGYLGIILLSTPVGLVNDGCYTASRISIAFTIIALGLTLLLNITM